MKRLDDIGYPEDASLVVIFSGIDSATGFLMKPLNFAALWRAIDHRVATFGGAA